MEFLDSIINGAREISKCIQVALETDEGALIGRNGTIELEQMIFYNQLHIHAHRQDKPYPRLHEMFEISKDVLP